MMMRNIVQTIYIIYLFSLCTSCNEQSEFIDRNRTFYYNQTGGLESLDPAFAKSLAIMWQINMIYNRLVEIDEQLQVVPSLAYRYEVDSGGLIYRFFLRDNVFFHDNEAFPNGKGRKMVATDVVYSFDRIIDPSVASPGSWVFNGKVASKNAFTALNDSIVEIRLSMPFAPFLELLSMQYCSIVPREVIERYGSDFRNHPCGTGPFQMVRWDEGNTLILHKNQNYWEYDSAGTRLPYLEAVKVSFSDSKAMEYLMMSEGKLDYMNGIDGTIKDLVLTKNGQLKPEVEDFLTLQKRPYLNTEYLGILMDSSLQTNPALKINKVREAINMGIDKRKIVTYFRNGIGIPAVYGFTPNSMPGMESRTFETTYHPSKAAAMIQEVKDSAGWNTIQLEISTPEALADMCNFIAQQLSEIGIIATVQVYQPGMMRQLMSQGQVNCFKGQWIADYPDAETYLAYFYSKLPAPPNYTRYNNQLFDQYYERAIQTEDPKERASQYRLMDSITASDYAVIPLFYDELMSFIHKDVLGMSINPMNIIDIRKVSKKRKD